MSLGSERDPSVGLQEDGATFTIFMPSLSALRWLADL
jgi:hypothetical protein